jgi:type IV pilus assembly protein PilQ
MKQLRTEEPRMGTRVTRALVCGVGAVLLTAATLFANGEGGAVVSVSVAPASGRTEVVVGVDGAVTTRDFVIHNPDRIVVDIVGATLGVARGGYDRVARGGVLDVRYAQNQPNVVRVVLTVDHARPYQVTRGPREVRVSVDGGGSFPIWSVGNTPAGSSPLPPTRAQSRTSLAGSRSAVGFTAAPSTSNALTVSSSPVHPDSVRTTMSQGAAVLVHATVSVDTPPPSSTAGGVPVIDTTKQTGANRTSQMAATPPAAAPVFQGQTSQQQRITISWDHADIRDVLAAFAAFSGRTILPAKGVEGTITAEIINQPWDVAMQAILNANGFGAVETPEGIIIVSTLADMARAPATEPLETRAVRLNYSKAGIVAELVRQRLSRDCSSLAPQTTGVQAATGQTSAPALPAGGVGACPQRGAVIPDTLTNTVSITDVRSAINDLEEYTRSLDVRQPQVNIKAKIILVDRSRLEGLGLKYDLGTRFQHFNDVVARTDSTGNAETGNVIFLGGNTISAIANASSSVADAALRLVYSAALGAFDFTTFLEALQENSLLDVQAEPSVTTLNNRQATLTAGTQVPYRTIEAATGGSAAGAFPRATVGFRQTGITLIVTPQITNNRQIQMRVHAENSDVQFQSGDVGAVFPEQIIENELLVADGETAVMGGLTQTSVRVTKSGIPILVDLPLIGRLFGVTNRQETKRDLLILITPHIVDEGQTAADARR